MSTANNGISYKVEEITPDRARELLRNVYGGREPNDATVGKYADAMRAGGWVLNGMPIILGPEGQVLDGVNRLAACIEADASFKTLVARGVKADTLHVNTIDAHRRRTYRQIVEARGFPGAVFDALGKVIRTENGILGMARGQISWVRYDATIDAPMPGKPGITVGQALQSAVNTASDLVSDGRKLNTLPHRSRPLFIFFAEAAGHGEEVIRFLHDLSVAETGSGDLHHPSGTPRGDLVIKLADETRLLRSEGNEWDADFQLGRASQAFNAWLKNEGLPARWKIDLGNAALSPATGAPLSWEEVKENAPANLGLPMIEGYPGIPQAELSGGGAGFTGETAELLMKAAERGLDHEDDDVVQTVRIDADLARKWLSDFNRGNRSALKDSIEGIARDIVSKLWRVNAQPIAFSGSPWAVDAQEDGTRLLNGQHRLMGLIRAQEMLDKEGGGRAEIELPVVVGIPEEAFATYDVQERRAPGVDTQRGDPRVIRAAAKHLARLDRERDIRSGLVNEALKNRRSKRVLKATPGDSLKEHFRKVSEKSMEDENERWDTGADAAVRIIVDPFHLSRAFEQRLPVSAAELHHVIEEYDDGGDLSQSAVEARHGDFEKRICSAGVGAAFICMIRDRTEPVEAANNFIELLKHGADAGETKRGDPLFRRSPANGHDGKPVLSRDGLIEANKGTASKPPLTIREQMREILRTWQAHADFMGGIKTNLWWPGRDLDEMDVPASGPKRKRLEEALDRLRREREFLSREHDDGRPADDQLPLEQLDLPY